MRHLWTLLYFFVGATQATQDITATPGQDVILTCRDPDNNFTGIKWARPDQIEEYVYLERDGHFEPHNQDPSFHNRVALDDREKTNGNVSLNLKNVTTNDTGAYECRVFINESYKSICNVTLRVDPPGQTGGDTEDGGKEAGGKEDGRKEAGGEKSASVGQIIGLTSVAVVVVAVVVVLIYKTYKKCCQDSHHPPTEPQIEMSERFLSSESPDDEQRDRNDPEANNSHQHSTRILDVTLTVENETSSSANSRTDSRE
ncbi:unnamed protein product [Oreochromis niloticus]|nr:unnamed protein product [Mustela putorius furo]